MSDAPLPRQEPMWSRGPRLLDRITLVIMCLALVVEVLTVASASVGVSYGLPRSGEPIGGYLAVALSGAGLWVGRRNPWGGIAMVAVAPIVSAVLGWDPTATWSVSCFAAFWFAVRGVPGLPVAGVFGLANVVAVGWFQGTVLPTQSVVPSISGFIAVLMATTGSAVRAHQQLWFLVEQRAREEVVSRRVAVERSVAEERLRIARDLHDSVGHQIAVVNMHLSTAEVHLPKGADQSRDDLHAARAAVQAVLRETQQILKVLRVDNHGAGEPTPGYEQILPLVDRLRASGFTIVASMPPRVPRLPPSTGTAAFRIVQEALTNAQRYGTGSASLTIEETGDSLSIHVTNTTHLAAVGPGGGGHGLVGMRERAETVGGSLETGTRGNNFWARAQLPIEVAEGARQ